MLALSLLVAILLPFVTSRPDVEKAGAGRGLMQHFVSSVFVNGFDGYRIFPIPAIVHKDDSLLAFVEARRHGSDQDHTDILMKRSLDGGRTWSQAMLVAGDPSSPTGTMYGQPTPIVDPKTQKILLIYCINNTWVFQTESSDVGATWSAPRNITAMVKRPGWGWMATGPVHGLAMRSGRLIVPFNTFLAEKKVVTEVVETGCAGVPECSWYNPGGKLSLRYLITNTADPSDVQLNGTLNGTVVPPTFTWAGDRSGVLFSDDHGSTWHVGGQITDVVSSSENTVEELFVENRSELLMSFRIESADTHCRKFARSSDGGLSFHPYFEPRGRDGSCIPDPVCQGSLLSLFGGRLLLTSGPGSPVERVNLRIYASTDGGRSFNLLGQLMDGASWYSDLVFLGGTPEVAKVGVVLFSGAASNACYLTGGGGIFFVSFEVRLEELELAEHATRAKARPALAVV